MRPLFIFLLSASLLAQQPSPGPRPQSPGELVIRTTSDLVLIDVHVTDRSGRPIKGLKPEQFTVFEDDRPQKISSFDYFDIETIETAASAESKPIVLSLGAAVPPEKIRETVRDRRLIVLFFDLTSLQPDELLRANDAALRYLRDQMTPADVVSVVTFGNRLAVTANFTNDREALLRAVMRLRAGKESQLAEPAEAAIPTGEEEGEGEDAGDPFTPDEAEFNIFNTDRKLAALESLSQALRNIPGKKSLIHFTGGVTQTGEENRSQLRAATDAANRANVSYYTVDARGLQATVPGGEAGSESARGTAMFRGVAVFRQSEKRQDSRETLSTLASDTGGRSFFDLGDFREVFQKVQQDASGYYLLGYYRADAQMDGRWRRVRVRVNVPGVRIRHREGYYAPKEYGLFTTEDRERQLQEAMSAEVARVELPIAVETARFRLGRDEIFVPIAAKLASSALEWAEKRGRREAEFDFAAELREDRSGRVVGALRDTVRVRLDRERFQQVSRQALVYEGGVILGPGNYRLRFLARENETGRIGTFEQKVVLPAPRPERLELSSLLLSSQMTEAGRKSSEVEKKALARDARLAHSPLEISGQRVIPSVTHVFTAEQQLHVLFQAYLTPKMDASRVRAGLVFFRNGVLSRQTPLLEPVEVEGKTGTATFRISLPLAKLPPGRYAVQAVAVEVGGEDSAFARSYFALRPPPAQASGAPPRPGR